MLDTSKSASQDQAKFTPSELMALLNLQQPGNSDNKTSNTSKPTKPLKPTDRTEEKTEGGKVVDPALTSVAEKRQSFLTGAGNAVPGNNNDRQKEKDLVHLEGRKILYTKGLLEHAGGVKYGAKPLGLKRLPLQDGANEDSAPFEITSPPNERRMDVESTGLSPISRRPEIIKQEESTQEQVLSTPRIPPLPIKRPTLSNSNPSLLSADETASPTRLSSTSQPTGPPPPTTPKPSKIPAGAPPPRPPTAASREQLSTTSLSQGGASQLPKSESGKLAAANKSEPSLSVPTKNEVPEIQPYVHLSSKQVPPPTPRKPVPPPRAGKAASVGDNLQDESSDLQEGPPVEVSTYSLDGQNDVSTPEQSANLNRPTTPLGPPPPTPAKPTAKANANDTKNKSQSQDKPIDLVRETMPSTERRESTAAQASIQVEFRTSTTVSTKPAVDSSKSTPLASRRPVPKQPPMAAQDSASLLSKPAASVPRVSSTSKSQGDSAVPTPIDDKSDLSTDAMGEAVPANQLLPTIDSQQRREDVTAADGSQPPTIFNAPKNATSLPSKSASIPPAANKHKLSNASKPSLSSNALSSNGENQPSETRDTSASTPNPSAGQNIQSNPVAIKHKLSNASKPSLSSNTLPSNVENQLSETRDTSVSAPNASAGQTIQSTQQSLGASTGNTSTTNFVAKFCPECGHKFSPTDKFCSECGTRRL
ncbi:hypothetical protein HK102_013480 [Quaeritorhiza haematococci]|nr:hypothetical protein HK102_013480 [Quaeritorhiza haematococci]